jgi:hypothetical protein
MPATAQAIHARPQEQIKKFSYKVSYYKLYYHGLSSNAIVCYIVTSLQCATMESQLLPVTDHKLYAPAIAVPKTIRMIKAYAVKN